MAQIKHLYLVSLVSFVMSMVCWVGVWIYPRPISTIFALSFSPLNVSTSTQVDSQLETLTFDQLNQHITIIDLANGIYTMEVIFVGGELVAETVNADQLPIRLSVMDQTFDYTVQPTGGLITHTWKQSYSNPVSLTLNNFAKLEGSPLGYSLIVSHLRIQQH